jgi:DNA repair protein RecO (recombination protein O)
VLVKTEVIVLRSMKYRETSKIVTFYSKEYGKLKGIAKGARTAKNKFGSGLEPLSHSMLLIYKKEHRELHLISQCDSIDSFRNLTEDLDRMSAALSVLELVDQVTHHEERTPPMFALLVETLSALNASTKNYQTYLQAFQLRFAALFGYAPNFDACGQCGKPVLIGDGERHIAFQIVRGAVFCTKCCAPNDSSAHDSDANIAFTTLSIQGLQIVRRLVHAQLSSLSNIEFDARVGNEMNELLRLYLRYHFDGFKPLKSAEFFHQQQLSTM